MPREAPEAARQEAAALPQAHSIQHEFLSRLVHELRTPLTAIHGYASSLRQPDVEWDWATRDRFLASIVSESGRMSRLVADLLDLSAWESGRLHLHRDWCDLRLLLGSALTCIPEAESVDLCYDASLGPVWGDHDRLEQVFVNLIENALRHTPAGTPVQVRAGPGCSPGTVEIRVVDLGPGIPFSDAERLFRPYARGRSRAPGAGLGLSIARGIVEAHGGTLALEPVKAGTSFLVTLPVEGSLAQGGDADRVAETVTVWAS
jgi:signal transduction histidine kinase